MKIRCIKNAASDIPAEILRNYCSPKASIPLILNKEYIVYSISTYFESNWYCICDESYSYYPMWLPEQFFEISDDRLSRYWIFTLRKDGEKNKFFLGFPEWAKNLSFYDNLTDKEPEEVEIFQSYKKLMDLEFSNSAITEVAEANDAEWFYCSSCIDAWENSDKSFALVSCPKCSKVMNNPRYENLYPHC